MSADDRPYARRVVDDELDELMQGLAAISIEGAKGVGKTATALRRATTTHLLDDPTRLQVLAAAPGRIAEGARPVLVDEWQRLPATWDFVRRAVDADPASGQFLLTGSAKPAGPQTHSGAGRIVPVRMRPLSLVERGVEATVSLGRMLGGTQSSVSGSSTVTLTGYVEHVLGSGFPALRGMAPRALRAQLDGYLDRVVDREFAEQGLALRRPDTLRAWLRAYAAATATTASFEAIRDAATPGVADKPAKTTTMPWRDVLTRLYLLDPVPAWLPGGGRFRALGGGDKHFLADPALAARLLDADADSLLAGRDSSVLGALFESLVALNLRVYAQAAEARVHHLRTHGGEREVDFIVTSGRRVLAIEVKLAATVHDGDLRHLRWLKEKLGADLADAVVLTTGPEAYRRADGIAVVPAALLGP